MKHTVAMTIDSLLNSALQYWYDVSLFNKKKINHCGIRAIKHYNVYVWMLVCVGTGSRAQDELCSAGGGGRSGAGA